MGFLLAVVVVQGAALCGSAYVKYKKFQQLQKMIEVAPTREDVRRNIVSATIRDANAMARDEMSPDDAIKDVTNEVTAKTKEDLVNEMYGLLWLPPKFP